MGLKENFCKILTYRQEGGTFVPPCADGVDLAYVKTSLKKMHKLGHASPFSGHQTFFCENLARIMLLIQKRYVPQRKFNFGKSAAKQ